MKNQLLIPAILGLFLFGGTSVFADITDVNVDDAFEYKTQQAVSLDIQVNTPEVTPTGLTIYVKGVDGLVLLDNLFIDSSGLYKGSITIPANIRSVVIKSRWLDSFQEQTVAITRRKINAVFDHL